jgi:hypothetical protein
MKCNASRSAANDPMWPGGRAAPLGDEAPANDDELAAAEALRALSWRARCSLLPCIHTLLSAGV